MVDNTNYYTKVSERYYILTVFGHWRKQVTFLTITNKINLGYCLAFLVENPQFPRVQYEDILVE